MPKRWMVTDRNIERDVLGGGRAPLSYWVSDGGPVGSLDSWRLVDRDKFRILLAGAADEFPDIPHAQNEKQKHVTVFVHGYNNSWSEAVARYDSICKKLFEKNDLGICVLFSWPSDGSPLGYLPDRTDARRCAPDLADVLSDLYDWLLGKQMDAADPERIPGETAEPCRAKTSIIAHSMGNYLLQKAMQQAWTRKNSPLLVSLVNQLLMVAADVDNDLFASGETVDGSDGDAMANLTYRVTALYSGRDAVLGASAGLKHFGERRLGRSGLAREPAPSSNVWDLDCSKLLDAKFGPGDVHSAYFDDRTTLRLMHAVLRGADRRIIENDFLG